MLYYLSYMGELSKVSHDDPNAAIVIDFNWDHYGILP